MRKQRTAFIRIEDYASFWLFCHKDFGFIEQKSLHREILKRFMSLFLKKYSLLLLIKGK